MKFITFKENGKSYAGIKVNNVVINLNSVGISSNNMLEVIEQMTDEKLGEIKEVLKDESFIKENGKSFEEVSLRTPIKNLKRNVICLGLNYKDHVAETKAKMGDTIKMPKHPVYFAKMANEAIGHMDGINSYPDITTKLDYEVELAIVIGKDGINIKKEDAYDYIFGYTILNDISCRDLQKNHAQWFRGKSLDTHTVIGPWIVSKDEFTYPLELDLTSKVNGEIRQSSNTRQFIFDIETVIEDLSRGMTLKAGDIIATGTPSGVGMGFTPSKYIGKGDVVECYVEGIGVLKNTVK